MEDGVQQGFAILDKWAVGITALPGAQLEVGQTG